MRVLARVSADDVEATYVDLYQSGRHGSSPDRTEWIHKRGPEWVLVEIPLSALDFQSEDESGIERIRRAKTYARRRGPLPAGIASYGPHLRRKKTGRAFVLDGNHRVLAALYRGDEVVPMFMELSDFLAFDRDAENRS